MIPGIDTISSDMLNFDAAPAVVTSRQLPQSLIASQSGPSTSSGEPEIVAAIPLSEENLLVTDSDTGSPNLSPSKFKYVV